MVIRFKNGLGILFCSVVLAQLCMGRGEPDDDNRNVLILFALQPTIPAYKNLQEGLRTKLNEKFKDDYSLHMEYLETDRYPDDSIPVQRIKSWNEKYRNVKLDLLICIGINMVGLLRDNLEDYMLQLPAVSLDYDFSNYGMNWQIELNDKTTSIPLKVEAWKTIGSILYLLPGTTSVYFICGVAPGDRLFYEVSRQEAEKLPKQINVTFFCEQSMDEVLSSVRNLPANSIIIVSRFTTDNKGVNYYNSEAVRLINRVCSAPIFTYTNMGFGDGALGGYIMNFDKAGLLIGDAAVKILNGADPESIHYSEENYYEYMFDWRELKRWNLLDSERIPEGSTILYRDIHFFGKYRWIIAGGVLFILLQTLMIITLVRMNRKQRMMTQQIRDTENKFRELAREDRILRMGQLTASLSHELNQPLTSILSTAQAGLRFIDSNQYTPELLKEILQNIAEDDKRTASILASIRGMIKLEKREKEITEIQKMIGEIVVISRSETEVSKNELEISLPEDPVYILADPIQIQQVLLNFILNASQSNQRKNGQIKKIIISATCEKVNVIVSVRDYGEGISEEVQKKLFKPFVTSKTYGFGVGLAISRSIIDNHRGKIWAENMPDGGARFSFSLKIHEVGE